MKMDFRKNLPYYLLLAFFVSFVIFVFRSEGTAGGADDINHYRYARYAFENPGFFFDTKAKALFTMLFAPVAQLGYNAVRIFNVLIGLFTALLTFLTAKRLNYSHPLLATFLLVFAPMYTLMMLSGMTEILFSFLLILGIYLFFRNQSIPAAVVISLLPFVRTEGVVIIPLFLLAFLINRQWKAMPFLLTGFLVFSFAGSFHHGEFFWVITKNPYTGDARDIYGSGELLHYVKRFRSIFGLPFFVLIVGGLLYIPIHFFASSKEKRLGFIIEVLIGFLPFLIYFCAHSYVFWKGQGNSVGEIRVMAAVFPSAVLLAMFAWNHLIRLLPLPGNLKVLAGSCFAIYLIFVPFRVHRIPVELASTQKLIKEAATWLEDMDYADHKLYFWDPFWWYFLDKDPTDQAKIKVGVHDRNDPGRNISPGGIILWDAHYGPNEGRMPLERFMNNPDFCEIKAFRPGRPFQVLGGYTYEIHIFERLKSRNKMEELAILAEIRRRENARYEVRLLEYNDYERIVNEKDSSTFSSRYFVSGSYSYRLGKNQEFLPGIEIPVEEIKPSQGAKLNMKISHHFETYVGEKPLVLVMSLQKRDRIIFYKTWEIKPDSLNAWEETVVEQEFPPKNSDSDILKVYLWNLGAHQVFLDDFIIALKEPKV